MYGKVEMEKPTKRVRLSVFNSRSVIFSFGFTKELSIFQSILEPVDL